MANSLVQHDIVTIDVESVETVSQLRNALDALVGAGLDAELSGIPRSRHDPKILWVDDAEIVGDQITKVRPIPGTFSRRKLSVASANWAQVA